MFDGLDILYSVLLFIAIYFQVFFLLIFFENRKQLKSTPSDYSDQDYPTVSFLVPCWNEEKTAVSTIESLLQVDYPKDKLKIFCIDDGSTDQTWNFLQKFADHENVQLIKKENGGKHSALNEALKHTESELIVSFDADTSIEPKALKQAVNYFLEDKDLAVLGGAVLIGEPKSFIQKAQSIEYQIFSFTKKMLGLVDGVLVAPGAFSIYKREALQKVGGYRRAHNLEDVELTMRFQAHKMKIGHCHTAFVRTKGPESITKLFKQRLRWCYGFIANAKDYWRLILNPKHGNFGLITLPMNIFAYVMVTFVFFLGLYRLLFFIYDLALKLYLVGLSGLKSVLNFDYFFISTKPTVILSVIVYLFIMLGIYMGKKISKIKEVNLLSILYFIAVYSILSPLWVMKSFYNWTVGKNISWK